MEDAQYIMRQNEIADGNSNSISAFYQELEVVVRKHSKYLQEAAQMPGVEIPGRYLMVKRSLDIFTGVFGLLLLSPLLLVVAILVKIGSRGPILFHQDRVGKDGKIFRMHKFRTMVTDAEKETGPVWSSEDDPRVTFVGRFLRKFKIDELPQFVNLIKGEMTMVGPRPERPFFTNYFIKTVPGYSRRLDVLPGITGLAQLRNGYDRTALDVIRKLRFDISYIKKMNLFLDLRLLGETFLAGLKGKL